MGTSLAKSIWLRRYIHNYCLSYMFKSEFAKCSRFSQTVGIYCKIKWAVSFQDKKKDNLHLNYTSKQTVNISQQDAETIEETKYDWNWKSKNGKVLICFRKTFSDSEHLEMTQLNIYGTFGTWTPASRLQISWRTRTTHIVMNHDS